MTDEQLIKAFKDYLSIERNYSFHTVRSYIRDIKDFQDYLKINEFSSIQKISSNIPRYYLAYLNERFEPKSVNRKLSSLRSFYRFLVQEGVRESNPFGEIKSVKQNQTLPERLYPEDIEKLFKHVLKEFPVKEINIDMPTWVENLEPEHWLKKEYFKIIKGMCESVDKIRDIKPAFYDAKQNENLSASDLTQIKLGEGTANILLKPSENIFYKIIKIIFNWFFQFCFVCYYHRYTHFFSYSSNKKVSSRSIICIKKNIRCFIFHT